MSDIYLHLYSQEACALNMNGAFLGIIDQDNQSIKIITDEDRLLLYASPINSQQDYIKIPYSALLKAFSNKLYTDCDNITISHLGSNHFKIDINFPQVLSQLLKSTPPINKAIDQINFNLSQSTLIVQDSNNFFSYTPPCLIEDFEAKNMANFIILQGKTSRKQNYLLILNKKMQFVFDCIADKIEFNNNQIVTLKYINDIARHGLVTIYTQSENGFKKQEQYCVYTQDEPIPPANVFAIPWAFMEALNIGNLKLARSYLHPTLSTSLKDEHISAYFGDFVEVSQSINNDLNVLTLYYKGKPRYIKNFKFELSEGRISNIDLV